MTPKGGGRASGAKDQALAPARERYGEMGLFLHLFSVSVSWGGALICQGAKIKFSVWPGTENVFQ